MAKLLHRPASVLLEPALLLWNEETDTDEIWDVIYTLQTHLEFASDDAMAREMRGIGVAA